MQNAEPYRLFIAISLPEEIKRGIEKAQAELRRVLPADSVRWTRREQFHLTLKFIGDVGADRVGALEAAMRRACGSCAPLRLRAARIGFFPDARLPRVIWVGVEDDREALPLLHRAVDSTSAEFTRETSKEEFSGHVTLGRVKRIQRTEAAAVARLAQGMADRCFGEWQADGVEIMRSELSLQGARHTLLAVVPLAGAKEPAT